MPPSNANANATAGELGILALLLPSFKPCVPENTRWVPGCPHDGLMVFITVCLTSTNSLLCVLKALGQRAVSPFLRLAELHTASNV